LFNLLGCFSCKCREITILNHLINHALETVLPAVFRRENPRDSVIMQFFDFLRDDDTASAAINADVGCASFLQKVIHIFEVLHMSSLIRGNGDSLHILLDGSIYDFLHRTVMAEVDDLCPACLDDAAHNVDGSIMSVK